MQSLCLCLVISECSLSGRGHGHVSNFYIVDLENLATASRRYTYRWYTQLDRCQFVYDTYKTMKATRSHHVWVHMFITHCLQLNLQLHNFDLFKTCRTSSFCTVAWQLARFQLTPRIARSLGDSWASSGTTRVSQYQKGKTSLDLTEARDSEWWWHQLGHTRLHLAPDR